MEQRYFTFTFLGWYLLWNALEIKNGVFWNVTPCGLVLTTAKRRNIPEDTILHGHRRENLKSYALEMF
jgi:hypothetical protein